MEIVLMSIPPNAPCRGGAAFIRQSVNGTVAEDDVLAVEYNMEQVNYYTCRSPTGPNLYDIEYRSSERERDIRTHVFRFDRTPPDNAFHNGFIARVQENTPIEVYCDLERYVNNGGRPLDTRRITTSVFVSTTQSSSWFPRGRRGVTDTVYRYEIYAPGGILVAQTLRDRYRFPAQDEVAFIWGIAPQYIRSAQCFELTNDGNPRHRRVDNVLYRNRHFNSSLDIQNPVSYYMENSQRRNLTEEFLEPGQEPRHHDELRKRSVDIGNDLIEYCTEGLIQSESYIDAAFRSTRKNEVYVFIKEEYVLMNYAPGTADDRIVNGPYYIGAGFPSLAGTAFAEYGIDAAFGFHYKDDAIIFSGNLCARIYYAPGTTDDCILEGINTIRQMFPFFKGTSFENGIDAAFESTVAGEAYLFKGSEYALINYDEPKLIAIRPITVGFECLVNSGFESDIGAAFASHVSNEVYMFKGNSYILLHFTPGENGDYIIGGPKEIVPGNWPSLDGILPHGDIGLDVLDYPHEPAERDQDEFE